MLKERARFYRIRVEGSVVECHVYQLCKRSPVRASFHLHEAASQSLGLFPSLPLGFLTVALC